MQDGVNAAEIDALSSGCGNGGGGGGAAAGSASSERKASSKSQNPKLAKYQRMLKAGVPFLAVRAKAMQDGWSAAEIDALSSSQGGQGGGQGGDDGRPPGAPHVRSLKEPNPKLAKYQRMLKAGVPLPAVRAKATQDGLSAADIGAIRGGGSSSASAARPIAPPGFRKDNGLTKLHWKQVDESRVKTSIWGSRNSPGVGIDAHEEEHLKSTFAAAKKKKSGLHKNKSGANGGPSTTKKKISVLDAKRSHNVEICLAKFRSFSSYVDVADALNRMDFSRLRPDIIMLFRSVLPTADETRKLQAFAKRHGITFSPGNVNAKSVAALKGLSKAEKFMLTLALEVRLGVQKVESMLFLSEFADATSELCGRMNMILNAARQVLESDALVTVLRKVLAVGNTMNKGSHVGEVSGFTLESLPRLWSTKGHDKKTTVLDFVVRMLLTRDPHLADLPKKLGLLPDAKNVQQQDVLTQVQKLEQMFMQQQRKHGDGLFEVPEANAEFGRRLGQLRTTLGALVSQRDALVSSGETLAAYWGEDASTCAPEKVFGTLHAFCMAFNRSVLAFQHATAAEKRNTRRANATAGKGRAGGSGGGRAGGADAGKYKGKNKVRLKAKKSSGGTGIASSMSASPMLQAIQRRRSLINPGGEEDDFE